MIMSSSFFLFWNYWELLLQSGTRDEDELAGSLIQKQYSSSWVEKTVKTADNGLIYKNHLYQ